ncbi:hypothetical protein [Paracoccus sp. ME4]|uniref:hypothetical protein n=1 Tax=Paracoccus sp. ME4 TaxID=3138066 RepID=UPI00398B2F49
MSVQLHLINVHGEDVPVLWDSAAGDVPDAFEARQIQSMEDMEMARLNGTSNRIRTITIVESRDTARMMAMIEREDHCSQVAITRLADDAWVIGATWCDGSYDSGIPCITDARVNGEHIELDIDESLEEETGYRSLRDDFGLDILEVTRDDQPALNFG